MWQKKFGNLHGKQWLEAAGCIWVILGLMVYHFVHSPLVTMRQAAESVVESSQRQLEDVEAYQAAHVDEAAYEKELQEHQARTDKALPDHLEQGPFLAMLQSTALSSHIELQKVTPRTVSVKDGMQTLPVEVKFRSSYFELLSFLECLGECNRYVQVERTSLQEKAGALECTLELRIYAMGGKEAVDKKKP